MVQPPVLAVDIGGTKLAVAMMASDGSLAGLQYQPTHRDRGPEDVIARLLRMGHAAVGEAGWGQPAVTGISCGGPLDPAAGRLLAPPHLPGWHDIALADIVTAEFATPCALQNDATAAALAEYRYGAARGTGTVIYLTLSTGVGGGAVIGGRLMYGAAGNGGELGHITVRPSGRLCSCGRRGCLEAYASGNNIARRAQEAMASTLGSWLSTLPHSPTSADVAEGKRRGDPVASAVWDETVEVLGQALTDLVNLFEPDMVVLGGGVTRSGDLLLEPLRTMVKAGAMAPAAATVTIELAALGDLTGVVGAGSVAHDLLDRLELTA